jgi:hypothetical protein
MKPPARLLTHIRQSHLKIGCKHPPCPEAPPEASGRRNWPTMTWAEKRWIFAQSALEYPISRHSEI